ncbi:MAG: hypothetical protein VBE63_17140 [Lamprobacter sp.]|uniref:hypothetical protein n=1 Tax=Lamprobacter sp. TaxID=3100796 RepID=UPI002B263942|nr:hypothetical protein [Lamprobacter sp.]MEA3641647.1 hypothetical protein [Lamprobacter sp.]
MVKPKSLAPHDLLRSLQENMAFHIVAKVSCPLLRARDIRLLIIAMLLNEPETVGQRIAQMDIRHEQLRKDIERYCKIIPIE